MQKITPFLWFDGQAEEAVHFYVSLFKDARIVSLLRAPEGGHLPAGTLWTCTFQLAGQTFIALNGGPMYKFSEAVSMYVDCEDQAEIDFLWDKLCDGGETLACGWLKDRYGLTWQIIPRSLTEMLASTDSERLARVIPVMLDMVKLNVQQLEDAWNGV